MSKTQTAKQTVVSSRLKDCVGSAMLLKGWRELQWEIWILIAHSDSQEAKSSAWKIKGSDVVSRRVEGNKKQMNMLLKKLNSDASKGQELGYSTF